MTGPSRRGATSLLVAVLGLALVLAGCPKKDEGAKRDPSADAGATTNAASPVLRESEAAGDAARGAKLVVQFECNRCHAGAGGTTATQMKDCVGCHADILEGRFKAPAASLAKWTPRVKDYTHAPTLGSLGKRVTRRFVEDYLLLPVDLRPHLAQSMPRLALTRQDAKDLAAYLVPPEDAANDKAEDLAKAPELAGADLGSGRKLLETKGCGSCHAFSGVAALAASAPPPMDPKAFARAHALAPDLRAARTRTTAAKLVRWLRDPKAVKPDTDMPKIDLTANEARDLAAYILTVELAAPEVPAKVTRLPLLTRKVTFAEVDEKVFHRTCWHCHSEPDYAIGDGGPGNSGGFGFKPRGLSLSSYQGIAAGFVDDKGERTSVFAKDDEGVPRLVKALLARHEEQRGSETGPVRGMPLGYPALSLEEIQLVDTWVAQGRPR